MYWREMLEDHFNRIIVVRIHEFLLSVTNDAAMKLVKPLADIPRMDLI